MSTKKGLRRLLPFIILSWLPPAALAINKDFIGPSGGLWSESSNWLPANKPTPGDTARLRYSGAGQFQINFDDNSFNEGTWLESMTLDATGGGNITLNHLAAVGGTEYRLFALTQYVGFNGRGTYIQDGGINRADSFFIAYNPNSRGTFTQNNGQLTTNTQVISDDSNAQGLFIQNDGTNEAQISLTLAGFSTASNGTYQLNGGSLTTPTLIVGDKGTGAFTQTGGALGVGNTLTIAARPGSVGAFDQQAGAFSAYSVINNGTFKALGNPGISTTFTNTGAAKIGGTQFWGSSASIILNAGQVELLSDAGIPATATDFAHPKLVIQFPAGDATLTLSADQDFNNIDLPAANPGRQSLDLNSPSAPGAYRSLRVYITLTSYKASIWSAIRNANAASALDARDGIYDSSLIDGAHPNSALGMALLPDAHGANHLLIRPTRKGDLNLDGAVTIADFIDLAAHFNQSDPNITWQEGDINYDSSVTIADFIDLAANFNQSYAGSSKSISPEERQLLTSFAQTLGVDPNIIGSAVPDPATFSLLAGLPLIPRGRRTQLTVNRIR